MLISALSCSHHRTAEWQTEAHPLSPAADEQAKADDSEPDGPGNREVLAGGRHGVCTPFVRITGPPIRSVMVGNL